MASPLRSLLNRPGGAGRSAVLTFGLRLVSTGLAFATSILLARLLNLGGYGVYALVTEWLTFLAIPTALGMDRLMVREIAVYRAQGAWGKLHGFLRWGNLAVFSVSLFVAALGAAVVLTFVRDHDGLRLSFLLALASLPLLSLTTLRQAAMRGFDHIVGGQWPELLLRPLLLLALSVLAWRLLPDFSAPWAVGASVTATLLAFSVGAWLLARVLRREAEPAAPSYELRAWLRTALPFLVISGMYVLNARTSSLMLGALESPTAVGLYVPAARGADLIALVLLAVNTAFAPTLARLFAQGKRAQLEHTVSRSTRLITLVSLPVALGFILFGGLFLSLFGPEFAAARTTLTILSVGQLINAATGTVGTLLNMTGHERDVARAVGVSAVLNVALNALLIPRLGLEGAALATALSTLSWNVLLSVLVYRRLGFYSLLGVLTLRRGP
jgi:O-antigen/teichoic acid export membrane protein